MEYLGNKILTHLENHCSLDQNLVILKRKLEELNAIKEDSVSIQTVELRPRKRLKKEVEIWFQNVERFNVEIQNLETEVQESNCLSRGFLGKNVSKRIQEVEKLIQQGKSIDGLVIDMPQGIGQVLSTTTLFGEAAKTCMKDIWAYLMGDHVSKIGVWGMGGVGKTAIMKLIHNQLLKETEKFDIVIWATVSKEMNIFELQKTIAGAMNESLSEDEDKTIIAGKIWEMLAQKGKYVLILDDLWDEQFSLEEVGIPEPCNGSKLVVTTRLSDVCRKLGCREVRVPTLSKADAWSLFSEKVGQDVLNYPGLLPIVESVARECDGLPLAIVTIASTMRGELDIRQWRNALRELTRNVSSVNGMEGKVFPRLQFSYDRLGDEKLKHCFLCCALYPEDWEICEDDLINLWIAEGHVEEMDSKRAEIDKGHAILNKLKNNCLVECGTKCENRVKLHDVVRDMALRILSGGSRPRFLVKAGMQLRVIPDAHEWNEDLEKVSLMENWKLQIPPQMQPPNCQKLTTLLLNNCNIKSIPELFFEHMRGLKTLDLSGNKFKCLPNSISNLEALTTLLLHGCRDLEKLPSFAKLQALQKLDLMGTKIRDLPHGIERLVNLRYLKLVETEEISKVADEIFAKLTCLRHFAINPFLNGEGKSGLTKIEFVRGRFYDLNEFTHHVEAWLAQIKFPSNYAITVEGKNYPSYLGDTTSSLIIQIGVLSNDKSLKVAESSVDQLCEEKVYISQFIPLMQAKFSSLSSIHIERCKEIKKLFPSTWVLQNLHNLEELFVSRCEKLEEIIASDSEEEELLGAIKLTLPKLRQLCLDDLPELKSICSANGVMAWDLIKNIMIVNCPKLKGIPLGVPLSVDGQPSPFSYIKRILIKPREQRELMEWNHPIGQFFLKPMSRGSNRSLREPFVFNQYMDSEQTKLRMQQKRKRLSFGTATKRLRLDMGNINVQQKMIKMNKRESHIKKKIKAIEMEYERLRKATKLIMQQRRKRLSFGTATKRLRLDMGNINVQQKMIKANTRLRHLVKKFEGITMEYEQHCKEAKPIMQQYMMMKLRLACIVNILRARENQEFDKEAELTLLLRKWYSESEKVEEDYGSTFGRDVNCIESKI